MTRGDDGGVVFVVEGGAAEVNEPHRGVVYPPLAALLRATKKKEKKKQRAPVEQQVQIIDAHLCQEIHQQLKESFQHAKLS